VPRDVGQAVSWWQKAADQGDSRSMTILGVHYNWGIGVAQDQNRAATLMFRALSNGDESAMREITSKGASWGEPFLRELQRLMLVAGVYSGPADGKFGADTKLAVQELAQK
jgi:TPR repeat protein